MMMPRNAVIMPPILNEINDGLRLEKSLAGETTLAALQRVFPYTWIVDPAPLPPYGAVPELGIQDWQELKRFSQKQRELVLKISGFSEHAWGSRGVYVGHDLPASEWMAAVDRAGGPGVGWRGYIRERYGV